MTASEWRRREKRRQAKKDGTVTMTLSDFAAVRRVFEKEARRRGFRAGLRKALATIGSLGWGRESSPMRSIENALTDAAPKPKRKSR